jgi:proteic killer suppression protein
VIQSFADSATEDIYNGRSTKAARKLLPLVLHAVARRKLDALNAAESLQDLLAPPGNRLEGLKADRRGPAQHPGQ